MDALINYIQLATNTFALVIAGWLYAAYIKNLNSTVKLKDEQISLVEKNMNFFKAKVEDLEKRSPENIEKALNERIKIREEEIKRLIEDKKKLSDTGKDHQNSGNQISDVEFDKLHEDKESIQKELTIKEQELARIKVELEKAKDFTKTMTWLDDGAPPSGEGYEIEEIGFVSVDSGTLMITDPCYIDSEWQPSKFDGIDNSKISFSHAGASFAAFSDNGYGVMPFKLGHKGAGIAIRTVHGDGVYPVYAEKYQGEIVRVYFNLE